MANDNKDNNELNLDKLDNIAGGGGILPYAVYDDNPDTPFTLKYMDEMVRKYGVDTYRQAADRMTKEEIIQMIQEIRSGRGRTYIS